MRASRKHLKDERAEAKNCSANPEARQQPCDSEGLTEIANAASKVVCNPSFSIQIFIWLCEMS